MVKTQETEITLESKRDENYARESHLRQDNDDDSDDKTFNECLFMNDQALTYIFFI